MAQKDKVYISQRAYAKHRGVYLRAVQVAIQNGAVPVNADGKINIEEADAAWAQNVRPRKGGKVTPAKTKKPPPKKAQKPPEPEPEPVADPQDEEREPEQASLQLDLDDGESLVYWQKKKTQEQAVKARLEREQLEGKLVDALEVRAAMIQLVTNSKTKLLAMPGKAKSRLPHLTADDILELDTLVRESLEELAAPAVA